MSRRAHILWISLTASFRLNSAVRPATGLGGRTLAQATVAPLRRGEPTPLAAWYERVQTDRKNWPWYKADADGLGLRIEAALDRCRPVSLHRAPRASSSATSC